MRYYVVDVFTDKRFHGNPAGVCLLNKPLDATVMQQIAAENNLAETAFLLHENDRFSLRWFTPKVEIDLCGHATLATALVLMNEAEPERKRVEFETLSGTLTVTRQQDVYFMDFPRRKPVPCDVPALLSEALGVPVIGTHRSRDLVAVLQSEEAVRTVTPDFARLKQIDDVFAVIVTAKGERYDFVSRFFAPNAGIDEDPVTGSSHSTLIPFWSERLGKTELTAAQLSPRGGTLLFRDTGERVIIGGTGVVYLTGEIVH